MRTIGIRLTGAGLLLAAAAAAAQGVPASFKHPELSLASLIEFPELRGDAERTLRCAAQLSRRGKLESHGCYLEAAGDEVFVEAVNKAAKKARLTPAQIDGKPAEVYIQYRVRFVRKGEEQTLMVFNNPGLQENIDAYGEDHVAPQRGLTDESWTKACPRRTRYLVWAKAHVAEDGSASHFSLVPGTGPPLTGKCSQAILATLAASRYTAARADGEPVPSSFIEPFGS